MSNDTIAAGLFYLFAAMAGVAAIGLVVSRNIVRSAVCLLFTLTGVAGLYFLLGAEFLAAVQLVVYAFLSGRNLKQRLTDPDPIDKAPANLATAQ